MTPGAGTRMGAGMEKREKSIRRLEAGDERQYMMNEDYEVYEKLGAPMGAISFHYHSFYEIIYVLEGEYSSMIEDRTYHMKKGDFLLIDQNVLHKYHYVEAGKVAPPHTYTPRWTPLGVSGCLPLWPELRFPPRWISAASSICREDRV